MSNILLGLGGYVIDKRNYKPTCNWEHLCGNCDNFPGTIPKDYDGECPYAEDFFNREKFEETDWTLFDCPKFMN